MGKVFAVGVGPGSPNYVTETVRKIVADADVVVGYKYTLDVIADLIKDKKTHVITMAIRKNHTKLLRKSWGVGFWLSHLLET